VFGLFPEPPGPGLSRSSPISAQCWKTLCQSYLFRTLSRSLRIFVSQICFILSDRTGREALGDESHMYPVRSSNGVSLKAVWPLIFVLENPVRSRRLGSLWGLLGGGTWYRAGRGTSFTASAGIVAVIKQTTRQSMDRLIDSKLRSTTHQDIGTSVAYKSGKWG